MNTLTIDQAVYDGAALTKANDMELEEALKYVSTLSAKGGRTVPVDENGRDARIEKYVLFIFQKIILTSKYRTICQELKV